ncbi:GNAT family N-acetyltransferase [Brevibacillus centrosporus]|uniref:GNAT family N-acetyltransferase n=1 Tax=Brevibacillus centrosporus TaxID=54910 RepID=UPI002E1A0B60|nr:GNAT family N-acetyltransferase [Brevibacillus centrosporus]
MSFSEFDYPSLETERLNLRILSDQDTEAVYNHFSDDEVTKYMDIKPCKDRKETEEIIQFHLLDSGCPWGIFEKGANHS